MAAYKTLIALSSEVGETTTAAGLDPLLVELLRIRTSQINGCVFCLRMGPMIPSCGMRRAWGTLVESGRALAGWYRVLPPTACPGL
ncbi:carboxymuconolactone decarboxylase family protein [Streptomyces sp. NPDC004546]|uniref:carboxymuconolactone decarboxylase family protein n=1 Tax=unclassified Streptomyces TaxID=2593676 RepID=UPI0033AF6E17